MSAKSILDQWLDACWMLEPEPDPRYTRCSRAIRYTIVAKLARLSREVAALAEARKIDGGPLLAFAHDIEGASPEVWGAARAVVVRMQGASTPSGQMEQTIVEALERSNRRFTRDELADKAGYRLSGSFGRTLSNMVKTGKLTNHTDSKGRGYGLPDWN